MLNNDKRNSKEKTGCECPFCDEPACPVPEGVDLICKVAMEACPACKNVVRKEAVLCPHCGKTLPVKD